MVSVTHQHFARLVLDLVLLCSQIKHFFTENVKVLQEYLNDKIIFKTLLFKSIYKPEDDPRRRIPIREKVTLGSML